AHPRARARMRHLEPEAAVRQAQDLVRSRLLAPGIGNDHDLELEALRGVDRQQPHRVCALLLRDGIALGGADGVLLADEADEALDVGAAQLLVRARKARELAEVGVPTLPVTTREHRQVVVVLDEDALTEKLE